MRSIIILIIFALTFMGFTVNAQSILGRAVIDGQTVLILSDGTWQYESSSQTTSKDCHLIEYGMSFCGSAEIWKRMVNHSPDLDAQYQFDDLHYGIISAEGVGSDHGFDKETMHEVVLQNAANFTGLTAKDIPVSDIFPSEIDTIDVETIVYHAKLNDIKIVFANAILILPQSSFQVATFSIGPEFTEKHKEIHKKFLENVMVE